MSLLSSYVDGLYEEPKLKFLFWEATTRCNLSCRHCGSDCGDVGKGGNEKSQKNDCRDKEASLLVSCEKQTEPDKSDSTLTAREMRSFLDEFSNDFAPPSVMLFITGGEPLMRTDLFDVMAHADELGFNWGMTTNGLLLTEAAVSQLRMTHCKTLSVSLDGLPSSHNALRGADCYNDTIAAIRLLASSRAFSHVQVTTVIHKRNIDELARLYALMEDLCVDSWRLTSIEPIGRALHMADDFLDAADYRRLFDFIRAKRVTRSKIPVLYGCSHFLATEYEMEVRDYFFICGAGIYTASVLHNGDIYVCPDVPRKYGLIQGNIRKDRFAEVWRNGFWQFRMRRDRLNPICAECGDADYCRGDSAHTWDFRANEPLCCLKEMLARR